MNFGHTLGHAIESNFLGTKKEILHGEAIAIGMILEAFLSYTISGLSFNDLTNINKTINHFFKNYPFKGFTITTFRRIVYLQQQNRSGYMNNYYHVTAQVNAHVNQPETTFVIKL